MVKTSADPDTLVLDDVTYAIVRTQGQNNQPGPGLVQVQQLGAGQHLVEHEAGAHAGDAFDAGQLAQQELLVVVHVRHHHLELGRGPLQELELA